MICLYSDCLCIHLESTIYISNIVIGRNIHMVSVFNYCLAGYIVTGTNIRLAARYGHALNGISCCQCRIGIAILRQCNPVKDLGITGGRNSQEFRCNLQRAVRIRNGIACRHIHTVSIFNHCRAGYIITRSHGRLAAGHGHALDGIARCQCRIRIIILCQCRPVIYLGVAGRRDGDGLLGNGEGSLTGRHVVIRVGSERYENRVVAGALTGHAAYYVI